ncbi:metallothionein [Pseudomonas sp. TH05]|uniref:metallothionein n=1 Tax=unclassified Pseudomonas TaxID=196821 RepID=UPI000998482D|nr:MULTISPECIES: metallothionein [unclassified Pseudomonas]MBK5540376.1 metallothionein [Pseudomonas sp. TH07]MBK5560421.1 metallothionein [Pseudomonas sp. TH05]OOV89924.1 metallothionein [Pseudomonas sp. MF4836]
MNDQTCACPSCKCKVGANAIVHQGKHYCCEGCAEHHAQGQPCASTEGCKCAEGSGEG